MNIKHAVGNVGSIQPLTKVGTNQTSVLNCSVAVNQYLGKNEDGSPNTQTVWYNLTLWGNDADNFAPWTNVGTVVEFVGTVEEKEYTAKNGEARTSRNVTVKLFNPFVVPKSQQAETQSQPVTQEEDDIPF